MASGHHHCRRRQPDSDQRQDCWRQQVSGQRQDRWHLLAAWLPKVVHHSREHFSGTAQDVSTSPARAHGVVAHSFLLATVQNSSKTNKKF